MERWKLDINPELAGRRAERALQAAFQTLPPRTATVLLYTLLNGWTTYRRFQEDGRCRLCECKGTVDCIEHFAFCKIAQAVATTLFHLPHSEASSHNTHFTHFLALHKEHKHTFCKRVLYLRVLYMLFNHAKRAGKFTSPQEAVDLAKTLLWHAAKGCAHSEKVARELLYLPTKVTSRKGRMAQSRGRGPGRPPKR